MDLSKELEETKKELEKLKAQYQMHQSALTNLTQPILETQGAIKALEKLLKEKNDKKPIQ